MSDRIHQYLQGRVRWDALSPAERADAGTIGTVVSGVRAFLDGRPAPDLKAGVMRRIVDLDCAPAPASPGILSSLLRRWWTPVLIPVRPALVTVGVAALLVLPLAALHRIGAVLPPVSVAGAVPERLYVQFRLQANASTVQLAGSFTNWQRRYELRQTAPGLWTVTVPLTQGVHDYAFVIDGRRWVSDPYAAQVSDGFGGTNSRLTLLRPSDGPQS